LLAYLPSTAAVLRPNLHDRRPSPEVTVDNDHTQKPKSSSFLLCKEWVWVDLLVRLVVVSCNTSPSVRNLDEIVLS